MEGNWEILAKLLLEKATSVWELGSQRNWGNYRTTTGSKEPFRRNSETFEISNLEMGLGREKKKKGLGIVIHPQPAQSALLTCILAGGFS